MFVAFTAYSNRRWSYRITCKSLANSLSIEAGLFNSNLFTPVAAASRGVFYFLLVDNVDS